MGPLWLGPCRHYPHEETHAEMESKVWLSDQCVPHSLSGFVFETPLGGRKVPSLPCERRGKTQGHIHKRIKSIKYDWKHLSQNTECHSQLSSLFQVQKYPMTYLHFCSMLLEVLNLSSANALSLLQAEQLCTRLLSRSNLLRYEDVSVAVNLMICFSGNPTGILASKHHSTQAGQRYRQAGVNFQWLNKGKLIPYG